MNKFPDSGRFIRSLPFLAKNTDFNYESLGMGALHWFSGCSVSAPEQVIPPHFLRIAFELKASGPPHVLKLWLGVSKDMLPVKYFSSNKVPSLCQSNFMEIIRPLQR